MDKIQSFRDLRVYQKLKALHLAVHRLSLDFPKFEMYELGSQVRKSSNSATPYGSASASEWDAIVTLTRAAMEDIS
jgi:hypothetical protein